ncbi:uncharacterized protein LOC126891405 [Diabrotica virgifera virgifera]|uniref:Uncharacterized protein n=1 Tax=Diabrotica virgifera virgifera TaxID=50390 RepID=A0ABM5L277_DIAVI|nr:uncharacterized protein LOC126891405 [Diabrotica virgifera virgifera]
MDFSENYSLKYATEVQSFHFGGSREQVSLHTVSVSLSFKNSIHDASKIKSFCTFSKNLNHGPSGIIAHLEPVFSWIREQKPNLKMIHFLSDGPSSQYRNQLMFYIFGNMLDSYFPSLVYSTWNYYETGHGKGTCDGIGGTVKRTADRLVGEGNDLSTFDILVSKLRERLRNITIHVIETDSMTTMATKIEACRSKTIPFLGTMKVHQVTQKHIMSDPITLSMKTMSCFQCCRDVDLNPEHKDSECPHYELGKIKYPSRRTQLQDYFNEEAELISCEPLLPELSPSPYIEQNNVQETHLENVKPGDTVLIKMRFKNQEYRHVCSILEVQSKEEEEEEEEEEE